MLKLEKPIIEIVESGDDFGHFVISPLEKGYGVTVGNALRRVLLSSIPGAAVTAVQIDGVLHEFSTIPGVKEDVAEIILNLKALILRSRAPETKILYLEAKGEGEVKASDIEEDAEVDILNPDLHIATLDSQDASIRMQIYVQQGKGYVPAEQNKRANFPIGVIAMDSFFSPVRQVSYNVTPTRVGQAIEYDKLELKIWTNGATSPVDAMTHAAQILVDHFTIVLDLKKAAGKEMIHANLLDIPIDKLHLSVRSFNALSSANIRTTGELITKTAEELLAIKNLGRRSLEEIQLKLQELGLSLKEEE
ncbi:MAG: DNA-directed RNA polymerase subunit alpha [Coprothermobacterota bacterium]|nr:DNA-directed RNA polymerase subunit alpha [Caldisericota bacterium]MDI6869135.1 DNA-directed RNA polymerase subunit alpha [Coprothermobacterota bacterium]